MNAVEKVYVKIDENKNKLNSIKADIDCDLVVLKQILKKTTSATITDSIARDIRFYSDRIMDKVHQKELIEEERRNLILFRLWTLKEMEAKDDEESDV